MSGGVYPWLPGNIRNRRKQTEQGNKEREMVTSSEKLVTLNNMCDETYIKRDVKVCCRIRRLSFIYWFPDFHQNQETNNGINDTETLLSGKI